MTAVTIQSNKMVLNGVRQLSTTRAIIWEKTKQTFWPTQYSLTSQNFSLWSGRLYIIIHVTVLVNNYKLAKCHQGKALCLITGKHNLVRVESSQGTSGHGKQHNIITT